MAPRTLASTWKQVEKLAGRCQGAKSLKKVDVDALDDLLRRINESKIVDALGTLFVRNYQGMEEIQVRLATSTRNRYPEWTALYSAEDKEIVVNPVGVLQFASDCNAALEIMKTPVARETFQKYRYYAYLAELRKLPSVYLLFLLLLREVAKAREVTLVEKKGGGTEEVEDEAYMILLWAFKELEGFFASNNGLNLRSEYMILWYESDWITGPK